MRTHDEHLAILESWTPEHDDLPDETALHLDDCVACRALFERRFPPVELASQPVTDEAGDTLLDAALDAWEADPDAQSRRRHARWLQWSVTWGGLLAAGLVATVLGTLTLTGAQDQVSSTDSRSESGGRFTQVDSQLQGEDREKPGDDHAPSHPASTARPVIQNAAVRAQLATEGDAVADGGLDDKFRGSGDRLAYKDGGDATTHENRYGSDDGTSPKSRKRALTGETKKEKEALLSSLPPDQLAEPRSTEHFTDYGFRPFVPTALDPLSTFSIDVDTASYSLTRTKLRGGYLPPPAAVRVEEFVNYLPYEYDRPTSGRPFAVDAEAAPSPFNPATHLLRIGIQGRTIAADARKPVHLTFLIDTSGSMQSEAKLGLIKRTLQLLVDALEDGDTVAVVTYAGGSRIALEPTPVSHRDEIERAIATLSAGGSTAMGDGIISAYTLADQTYAEGAVNRVILCSDGDANVGPVGHTELSELIGDYAGRGITLTTVGVGQGNYQDTTMERLANDGDGQYVYLDSLAEAQRVFVDHLTGTLEVIARDVKVQVDFEPDSVETYRLIGYENRHVADVDFTNDAVDAGEVGAGHQVTALYEVTLSEHPTGSLGTVELRYKAPGPEAPSVGMEIPLATSVVRTSFAEGSDDFRMSVGMATFAELLRDSPYTQYVTLGDVEGIVTRAQRVEYPEDAELLELVRTARRLQE